MADSILTLQGNPPDDRRQQRHYHNICCGLSIKDIIKFIIHLLLPFSLGIFTVVVTLYQQQVATRQRLEDRQVARIQREQDLNISALQRENDRLIAQAQRENDKRIADEKRTDDRELESRRYQLERDDFLDKLLRTHINTLAESIVGDIQQVYPAYAVRSRLIALTRSVVGQLDPPRTTDLIIFLYEALLLGENSWILGKNVQLNQIDLSSSPLPRLRLSEAHLDYATFAGADLSEAVFQKAQGMKVNFSNANCANTHFAAVKFVQASFRNASLVQANFIRADLTNSDFSYSGMLRATFASACLANVSFLHANMVATNLTEADLRGAIISDSQLENAISINNALLPNGTRAHDLNMVQNGDVDCSTVLEQHWHMDEPGIVSAVEDFGSTTNNTNCIFSARAQTTMWQLIDIDKPKYRTLHDRYELFLVLRVARGNGTIVRAIGIQNSINDSVIEYDYIKSKS